MYIPSEKTGNTENDAMEFLSMASSYIFPCHDIHETVCVLSNVSALIKDFLPDTNWAGFYIYDGERLVLGPFQGEPACFFIKPGKGVCGTSLLKKETLIVPDVEKFPGHIACSSASKSEMVVPVKDREGGVIALIDIDSPRKDRFTSSDKSVIEQVAHLLVAQNVFCGYSKHNS